MLPPPRLSRARRPLLALLPGAPPELWRYSRASLQRLATLAQTEGVRILTWTINSDFSVPALQWPAQQLYLHRGLAAARRLGVSLLRVNLGQDAEADDAVVARRLSAFAEFSLRRLGKLEVTVENHWGISSDIDRHLRIVRDAAGRLPASLRNRFGCCFDPHNVPRDGASDAGRERWWRELALAANHFHFKTGAFDASGNDTTLPHGHLLALLAEAGYQGCATTEFHGDGDAVEAVRKSRLLLARLWAQAFAGGEDRRPNSSPPARMTPEL